MQIEKTEDGNEVTLKLGGCLDTAATPEFAAAIEGVGPTAEKLVLDMAGLEFIASSALRLLVATKKKRGAGFGVVLTGMNDVVREVFDVTGMDAIFEVK